MPASPEVLASLKERLECWNTGQLDLMQSMYAPDAEADFSAAFPDGGIARGEDEMRRFFRQAWDAWEGVRMDPLDVIEIDANRYVVPVRLWGKGRRSGVEVDQRFAFLYTIGDDGLIHRNQLFPDTQAALAAAGAQQTEGSR
jgi:ketosteroid isomerase-like protein